MVDKRVARALQEHASLAASFSSQAEVLGGCAQELAALFHRGGRLLTLGSGPCGAIASLTANLFLHRLALERPLLPAVSLCHDAVLATALARDRLGHDYFARQLRSLACSGDLLLVFAGPHQEEALAQALAAAREIGCVIAVVVQGAGEALAEPPDFLFRLATDSVPRALEGCLLFSHLLVELVEGELFGI